MKSLKWLSFRGYWVLSASVFVSGVISYYAWNSFSSQRPNDACLCRDKTYLSMVPYCLILVLGEAAGLICVILYCQIKAQFHCIINIVLHYFVWFGLLIVNCCKPPGYTRGERSGSKIFYLSCFVCPSIYQICHHLFWILCEGIPADPSWAVPLFLIECFAMLALLIANSLYHQNQEGRLHVAVSALAVLFGLFTIVISFYNSSIGELTGNVLALGMVGVLGYVIKKSGLYKERGGANNNEGEGQNAIALRQRGGSHQSNNGGNH